MDGVTDTLKLYGKVKIGGNVIIGEYTVIGYRLKSPHEDNAVTVIEDNCIIGSHVIIYKGAQIGGGTNIDDFSRIGENVHIDKDCYVLYSAKIYDKVSINETSIIGGFICERAEIGKNVRIFGDLLHSHREPHLGWDDNINEESPIIEDCVFIGYGAKIIGGIRIQKNSYIAAGAVVTKNVPPKSIVKGINNILPYDARRSRLGQSQFFERC